MIEYESMAIDSRVTEPAAITRHEELDVYRLAFDVSRAVFRLTRDVPAEERYSLIDQVRRSSRSVCVNIAEAWRKRRYQASFQVSLNRSEAEAAETRTWMRFAEDRGYISTEVAGDLHGKCDAIVAKLVIMISRPDPWIVPPRKQWNTVG